MKYFYRMHTSPNSFDEITEESAIAISKSRNPLKRNIETNDPSFGRKVSGAYYENMAYLMSGQREKDEKYQAIMQFTK